VDKEYWAGLWGIAGPDGGDRVDSEDDDEDMEVDGPTKVKKSKTKIAPSLPVVPPLGQAGPGPTSLAALMAAVESGGIDEHEAQRLAAAYDKQHEDANPVQVKKKTKKRDDVYDVGDPFVDDSELMVDQPMFYHQPKRLGFYVAQGDVELCGVVEDE